MKIANCEVFLLHHSCYAMQRSSLEQVVLQAKVLDLGEPKAILALAPSPPHIDDIERTIVSLKEVCMLYVKKFEFKFDNVRTLYIFWQFQNSTSS